MIGIEVQVGNIKVDHEVTWRAERVFHIEANESATGAHESARQWAQAETRDDHHIRRLVWVQAMVFAYVLPPEAPTGGS